MYMPNPTSLGHNYMQLDTQQGIVSGLLKVFELYMTTDQSVAFKTMVTDQSEYWISVNHVLKGYYLPKKDSKLAARAFCYRKESKHFVRLKVVVFELNIG